MIDAASDPAAGSVVASAANTGRGPHSGGTQRRFCSSLPSAMIVWAKKPPEQSRLASASSPHDSSSDTRHAVKTSSMPPPPYSAGSREARQPELGRPVQQRRRVGMVVVVVEGARDRAQLALGEVVADLDQCLLLVGEVEEGGSLWRLAFERSFSYLNGCSDS